MLLGTAAALSQGIVIEDSFQTKGIIIDYKFKTADGSVHPAGTYSLKVEGTGRAGKVILWVRDVQGHPVGKLLGQYTPASGADTKASVRTSFNFAGLGFSPASDIGISPRGDAKLIYIKARLRQGFPGGAIEALLLAAAPALSFGDDPPVFGSTDSFLSKAVTIPVKFKTADGAIHPAGSYSFKVQGTGKPGQIVVWVRDHKGATRSNVFAVWATVGQTTFRSIRAADDKAERQRVAEVPLRRFDQLGFSSTSPVQVKLEGQQCLVFLLGGIPRTEGRDSIELKLAIVK
jgi:hypothetical protein